MDYVQEDSKSGGGRWSVLPLELLQLISRKVRDISDFVRFSCVCRSWQSATSPTDLSPQRPWAMLRDDRHRTTRYFYSPTADKYYTLDLPELCDKIICGSAHGWLVVLDPKAESVTLFNFMTKSQIQLPPVTPLQDESKPWIQLMEQQQQQRMEQQMEEQEAEPDLLRPDEVYIFDALLSSNPSCSDDWKVMAILPVSQKFAFCGPRDDAWTVLHSSLPFAVVSVAYHERHFYIIDVKGNTAICHARPSSKANLIPSMKLPFDCSTSHMVESCGELVVIAHTRVVEEGLSKYTYHIFTADLGCGQLQWSKVGSMSNHMLYVSSHHICVLPASNYGCATTCIYKPNFISNSNMVSENKNTSDVKILQYTVQDNQGYYVRNVGLQNDWKKICLWLTGPCWVTPTLIKKEDAYI